MGKINIDNLVKATLAGEEIRPVVTPPQSPPLPEITFAVFPSNDNDDARSFDLPDFDVWDYMPRKQYILLANEKTKEEVHCACYSVASLFTEATCSRSPGSIVPGTVRSRASVRAWHQRAAKENFKSTSSIARLKPAAFVTDRQSRSRRNRGKTRCSSSVDETRQMTPLSLVHLNKCLHSVTISRARKLCAVPRALRRARKLFTAAHWRVLSVWLVVRIKAC